MTINEKLLRLLLGCALFTGLFFSGISYAGICTSSCVSSHVWRLFHMPFEIIGIPFFLFLLTLFFLSARSAAWTHILGTALSIAVGSELWMLTVQKFIIKHWCPVCLVIGFSLFASAFLFLIIFFFYSLNKEAAMKKVRYALLSLTLVIGGFFLTFSATSKINIERVDEDAIKDKIAFGDPKSPIEIYIFTDWLCPACRQIEGTLRQIVDQFGGKARIIFVDLTVHKESINFTPVNLYILMNNKDRYFTLRKAFEDLARSTPAPSEMDLRRVFGSFGISYRPLPYSQVSSGTMFYKRMAKEFEVNSTPTIVIVNTETKRGKKFRNMQDITVDNISKTISTLSS